MKKQTQKDKKIRNLLEQQKLHHIVLKGIVKVKFSLCQI